MCVCVVWVFAVCGCGVCRCLWLCVVVCALLCVVVCGCCCVAHTLNITEYIYMLMYNMVFASRSCFKHFLRFQALLDL